MSKFKKKRGKTTPAISTASLPDIIFMLLFFFMVVTKLRDAELKLQVITPYASELTKLEEKSLVNTIYIGRPLPKYREQYGSAPRIQLDDKFAEKEEIFMFIQNFRTKVPEARHGQITSSLRIDGDVTMGIVQDVKTQLRKVGQLKLNYSAKKRADQG